MGGSDGTNLYRITVDSSGRLVLVGAAAAGAAVAGSPLFIGGTDGTNARGILVDTSGRPLVSGAAAEDAAAAGNPVLAGGRVDTADRTLDDGDAGALAVDAAGRVKVAGAAAEDAAVVGSPVLAGGRYDAADRTLDDGDVGALALTAAGFAKAEMQGSTAEIGLVDRNAKEVALHESLEIRDTNNHDIITASALGQLAGEKCIFIHSTLDKTLTVSVLLSRGTTGGALVYTEVGKVVVSDGRLLIAPAAAGTGATAGQNASVPVLG
ncbi:MAG: hypothetical protein Q8R92_17560, partial [Deltaproteobacteria bacterium]|nr:hypothetical protein [Deltaproteobacteria bacterium]